MSRPRLLAGVLLAALAGWWAAVAWRDRPEPPRTAFLHPARPDGRLRPSEDCPDCPHRGDLHDPDLGCLASWTWAGYTGAVRGCPCRRRGCTCPGQLDTTQPPGAR